MSTPFDHLHAELTASLSTTAPGLSSADALCSCCVELVEVDGAAVTIVVGGGASGTFGSSSERIRALDELQFTLGEGPGLDAVASGGSVMAPHLDSAADPRWPILRRALLAEGVRGVFALPITITSECVGSLDLFRDRPGPLLADALAGARLAAELASGPLLDLISRPGLRTRTDVTPTDDDSGDPPLLDLERVEVYQATGVLMSALGVDATEALLRLRAHAMSSGRSASHVARSIIDGTLVLTKDHGGDDPRRPGRSPR